MFSDVAGYSNLTEPRLKVFLETVLPEVGALIDVFRKDLVEVNTWGDAVVCASQDPYVVARLALDLRDFYRNKNWADMHLPDSLTCRIALHAGVVYTGDDPIRKLPGIIGTQVNLAARIEPVTVPGQVWVSEQFHNLIDPRSDSTLAFDDLQERPLAKKFGSARLFRLRRHHERADDPGKDIQPEQAPGGPVSAELKMTIHMALHGNESQRHVALDMLDQFPDQESVTTLIAVARNKSEPHRLRRMALLSIGKLRPRTAVPDLVSILEDTSELPDITSFVIAVLGQIRDIRALEPIRRALLGQRQLEPASVGSAILAISSIGHPDGIPILSELLNRIDQFSGHVGAIASACGVMPDTSFVEPLQQVARERTVYTDEAREFAISALILIAPAKSEELFIDLALDDTESQDVRFRAVGALAAVPTQRSKQVLQQLASDLNSPLCERAMIVLVKGSSLLEEQRRRLISIAKGQAVERRDGLI